jgi:hypothetical protein
VWAAAGWLIFLVAFVGLVIVRSAGLVLDRTTKPESETAEKKGAMPKQKAAKLVSATLETAWALGTSMLAGLPLLT